MKIFLISQLENTGYDTFDAAVVCAPDAEVARRMNPRNGDLITAEQWSNDRWLKWCSSPEQVEVEWIGDATAAQKQGLVLSSFHDA